MKSSTFELGLRLHWKSLYPYVPFIDVIVFYDQIENFKIAEINIKVIPLVIFTATVTLL